MKNFDLQNYLSNGVENIVRGIFKNTVANPKASLLLIKYAKANREARTKREEAEKRGEHIPPFLIASITTKCNLHCKGCYARSNHSCFDSEDKSGRKIMSNEEWSDVFTQAGDMGVSFILLAGGEPFMRKDVLEMAGRHKNLLFPVFTNGTMIRDEYMDLLTANRNLLPVLSIEGNEMTTDARRGDGVYQRLHETMKCLKERGILFGASITVNKNNLYEVSNEQFTKELRELGCRAIVYVEYVPMDSTTKHLAFGDEERKCLMEQVNELRSRIPEMLFVSFPGDEKKSGGCLAAGRGFFHINAYGAAEPCPFSPYSDTSLKDVSLQEALNSPLFKRLNIEGNLLQDHVGGCVLFEQAELVSKMI